KIKNRKKEKRINEFNLIVYMAMRATGNNLISYNKNNIVNYASSIHIVDNIFTVHQLQRTGMIAVFHHLTVILTIVFVTTLSHLRTR
ncbi:hypothetical protein ACJX0J_010527, partial [Zea mays]